MPKDKIPERVAALIAKPPTPKVSGIALANLRRVWDAGIPVAMGTDAGNIGTLHGPSVFREMALMAQAGLTPLQVLRSATVNGARAFGRADDLGIVEAGRLADLVILDGDPTADVRNLSTAWRVMKDGRLYDPHELMRSIGGH
jgi:imidazolonepropionase-like amidohydrolase